jgi:WD40 repeat protein
MLSTRRLLIGLLLLGQAIAGTPPGSARAAAPLPEALAGTDRAGDKLPAGALARMGTLRWRYDGTTTTLAYSPDGRLLAGCCAGKIILWESATGKRIRQLPIGSVGWLSSHCLDFSPDGKVLAVAHRTLGNLGQDQFSGKITFWDVATGRHVRSLEVPLRFSPSDLRFSPDGKSLAVSNCYDLCLCDATTGKQGWHQVLTDTFVFDFVFSPDSRTLAVILHKGQCEVQLWDADTGRVLRTFEHPRNTGIAGLAFSRDGKSLATATMSSIFVWQVATGKEQARLEAEVRPSIGLAFTPDGKSLISATDDTQVYLWDLETKKLRYRVGRPLSVAGSRAVLSPDGKTFAIGTHYSQVHLWDVARGKELFTDIVGHDYFVRSLAFSPDGGLLASGGDLRQVRLWDTKTWDLVRSLDSNAQMLSFSPDGKQLGVVPFVPTNFTTHSNGVKNKPMSIWDVQSGKETATFPEQGGGVRWGMFTDGGKRLVSFDGAGLALWDAASRKQVAQFPLPEKPSQVGTPVLTPDGKRVLLSSTKEEGLRWTTTAVHAFDLETGKERFRVPAEVAAVLALSADGKTLASGGFQSIRLWDLSQRREIQGLDPGFGKDGRGVSVLAFSPDGRLLASAGGFPHHMSAVPDAGSIRVWDVQTGKEMISFPADEGFVASLAFSPDSKRLLSGMWNGSILVWDITAAGGRKP